MTLSERRPQPRRRRSLGKARVVIGHHRINDDLAMVAGSQHIDLMDGLVDLLACGHQSRPGS